MQLALLWASFAELLEATLTKLLADTMAETVGALLKALYDCATASDARAVADVDQVG